MKCVAALLALGLLGCSKPDAEKAAPSEAVASAAFIAREKDAAPNESEAKTWVKRLADASQREAAIQRLDAFFRDALTKSAQRRDTPAVAGLLDVIAQPLSDAYVEMPASDPARKELLKLLGDLRDARSAPALVAALGESTEDAKTEAAAATLALAKAGKLTSQELIDKLWDVFAALRVSSIATKALAAGVHDAVVAVAAAASAPSHSYGEKALAMIRAPMSADDKSALADQTFWQTTAVQVLGKLRLGKAAKALVLVLLAPAKQTSGIFGAARLALLAMPLEAEPIVIAALKGTDPELRTEDAATTLGIVADLLALLSRPAARDALLEAMATGDGGAALSGAARTTLALALVGMPATEGASKERLVLAFRAAYDKADPSARSQLLAAAAGLYEPTLVEWLLKESASNDVATKLAAVDAALKLMREAQRRPVEEAAARAKAALAGAFKGHERELHETTAMLDAAGQGADAALKACEATPADAVCFAKLTDERVPPAPAPATANMKVIKAAFMAAMLGGDAARAALLARIEKVTNRNAREAVAMAIDHLAPQGDLAAADRLEKLIEQDLATGDAELARVDEALQKVAIRLRARAAR